MHQLTSSGEPGTIYNGIADWLYEEEILGQSHATYITNDGSKLAYISFNDTNVKEHALHKFGQKSSVKFRYPKAGTRNPTAGVFVRELTRSGKGQQVAVTPPVELQDQ